MDSSMEQLMFFCEKASDAAPQDWRADNCPRFEAANYATNRALAAEVASLAKAKGCSTATLSIAWVLCKAARLGVTCVPIPGTTSADHARTNRQAAAVELSDAEMARLEALGAAVVGARGDDKYVDSALEGRKRKRD